MIVDTSAVVAIVRDEDDAELFAAALARAGRATMSAATWVETTAVVDSACDAVASRRLDDLLAAAAIAIAALTPTQAAIARQAYRDYGKGSGHAAGLNLGDCFSYALARDTGEPLLFKGNDFAQTDLRSALG